MEQPIDYDSPWKEVLDYYFAEFMAFFFPQAYNEIDWKKDTRSLDTELQQITPDAELGKRIADKLIEVCTYNGEETWVLVHVEIQSQKETDFSQRMYIYNYRIFDRYKRTVVSLAILGDTSKNWRPNNYGYNLWGCRVEFEFPIIKLADYKDKWQELEESHNPFAIVVMAHLKVQESRNNLQSLKRLKVALVRHLHEIGLKEEDVLKLFRFIDWLIQLPEELENEFWNEIERYEEEKRMPYVTSVERIGIKKGIEQGIEQGIEMGLGQGIKQGIELGLELKFGSKGLLIMSEISKIEDLDTLRAIQSGIKTSKNVDELRKIYQISKSQEKN
ncbi:MAG: cytosolic protein [Candidatus Poribacteria bacterium]